MADRRALQLLQVIWCVEIEVDARTLDVGDGDVGQDESQAVAWGAVDAERGRDRVGRCKQERIRAQAMPVAAPIISRMAPEREAVSMSIGNSRFQLNWR